MSHEVKICSNGRVPSTDLSVTELYVLMQFSAGGDIDAGKVDMVLFPDKGYVAA
jgi:hypothetical protein